MLSGVGAHALHRQYTHASREASHFIRLTTENLARLDGTRAAQGHGRWRLREAQRVFSLSEEELYQHVREGKMLAYRARINDHWEWRVSPADQEQREASRSILQ
jgi:hypothetical protein